MDTLNTGEQRAWRVVRAPLDAGVNLRLGTNNRLLNGPNLLTERDFSPAAFAPSVGGRAHDLSIGLGNLSRDFLSAVE